MQAQLCCIGIDDGRMINVADPPPNILRVPRTVTPKQPSKDVEYEYDEYERDGITNAGLIRYVRAKHD